jgi:hypothetical protein
MLGVALALVRENQGIENGGLTTSAIFRAALGPTNLDYRENSRNSFGNDLRTPLHLASAQGHEQIVQYLIAHDVPLSPRNRWGETPVSDARRHGQARIVQLIEKHTAES